MSCQEIQIHLNLNDALNSSNDYFNIKKYTFNNNEYDIIKYDKEKLKNIENNDDIYKILSKYRSIIVRNNKVVVFSPQKSLNFEKFKNKYNNLSECWSEDFVDGTMINVFYDNINSCWEIATKSTVGGNIVFFNDIKNYTFFDSDKQYEYYNNITFRTMFFETCNANNFDLNNLDKNYSYTFVMQHPFNRIVTPITKPLLYLIKVYKIDNTNFPNVNIIEKNIEKICNSPPYIFINTGIQFINKYSINTTLDDLYLYNTNKQCPYYCLGSIIYNIDGTRTKIRNVNYEEVRKLRGNQPKLQYNYLSLKKDNRIKEFLHYYPEHMIIFNKFKLLIYNYTNELFSNYIECFIKKQKHLKDYDFQYKNHMYHLHQKYINELKPQNKFVDKKVVIDYINDLHPAQQMFVINYKYNSKNNQTTETTETTQTTETTETNENMEIN
tara:strand:+ start:6154 stop:7470 length:1317 start_codon:yes stop_codon:yes gene_type:complete